jgi:hypothetical protein
MNASAIACCSRSSRTTTASTGSRGVAQGRPVLRRPPSTIQAALRPQPPTSPQGRPDARETLRKLLDKHPDNAMADKARETLSALDKQR